MTNLQDLKSRAAALQAGQQLTYSPIAIKFASTSEEVSPKAVFPFRDLGEKWAVCQIIQKARKENTIYAMTVEDNWCWYPLISYGFVKVEKGNADYKIVMNNLGIPEWDKEESFFKKVPTLEYGSCYAIEIAPLTAADYVPDIILIYCDNCWQVRCLVGAVKYMDGDMLATEFDYVNSCCWSMLPTYKERKFRITLPDPGEILRAEIGKNEIIFSVPTERFIDLVDITLLKDARNANRPRTDCGLIPYFPRPEFIDKLYELWGLEHGGEISWTEAQRGY